MSITNDIWQWIGLFITLTGFATGLVKYAINHIEARLDALEIIRERSDQQLNNRIAGLEEKYQNTDREILKLKADLPLYYVRHEDQAKDISRLEVKIDGLARKIDSLFQPRVN